VLILVFFSHAVAEMLGSFLTPMLGLPAAAVLHLHFAIAFPVIAANNYYNYYMHPYISMSN
jgi:hypothetical protein